MTTEEYIVDHAWSLITGWNLDTDVEPEGVYRAEYISTFKVSKDLDTNQQIATGIAEDVAYTAQGTCDCTYWLCWFIGNVTIEDAMLPKFDNMNFGRLNREDTYVVNVTWILNLFEEPQE